MHEVDPKILKLVGSLIKAPFLDEVFGKKLPKMIEILAEQIASEEEAIRQVQGLDLQCTVLAQGLQIETMSGTIRSQQEKIKILEAALWRSEEKDVEANAQAEAKKEFREKLDEAYKSLAKLLNSREQLVQKIVAAVIPDLRDAPIVAERDQLLEQVERLRDKLQSVQADNTNLLEQLAAKDKKGKKGQ